MRLLTKINSPICIVCQNYAAFQNSYVDKDGNLCCNNCVMTCCVCNQDFLKENKVRFIYNCHYFCDKCQEKCKCGKDYCSRCNTYTCNLDCMKMILNKYIIRDISKIIFKYITATEIHFYDVGTELQT